MLLFYHVLFHDTCDVISNNFFLLFCLFVFFKKKLTINKLYNQSETLMDEHRRYMKFGDDWKAFVKQGSEINHDFDFKDSLSN